MTSFRRYLTIFLAILTLLSTAAPALALESEPAAETPTVQESTAPEPEGEESPVPEAAPVVTPEATPEAEVTPEPSPEVTAEPVPEETAAPEESPAVEVTPEPSPEVTEAPEATPEADNEPDIMPQLWQTPGNTDANILGGGTMLTAASGFYYSENGIWKDANGYLTLMAEDYGAGNLNLVDGWLYYTVPFVGVMRVSESGGSTETVLEFDSYIQQMYVIGRELRFLADNKAWSYDTLTEELTQLEAPAGVMGLIPTEYGNLYLTGKAFERSLWAETELLLTDIESCYTDSGYLVINKDGTWQTELEALFEGVINLEAFNLHPQEEIDSGLTMEEELAREHAYFESEEYLEHQQNLIPATDGASTARASSVYTTALTNGKATDNQYNIALRARQMSEVLWTPKANIISWANRGVYATDDTYSYGFTSGKTYRGIPYSQAVHGGYVGWDLSIGDFLSAVNNTSSKMYTSYSTYGSYAPYYGSDCSGFVSWAWQLNYRRVCSGIGNAAVSSKIGNNYTQVQLGDCINDCSTHVTLVTDIGYDYNGNIVSIEITEQTPAKMRVTVYGELIPGKRYDAQSSLEYFQRYYFVNHGYYIYRRTYGTAVTYTPDPNVPIDEDGWVSAPEISLNTNADATAILVTLSHESGHDIYYTTDGSEPTTSSTKYTEPFALTSTATVRAFVDPGEEYNDSFHLSQVVTVAKAEVPLLSLVSGALHGTTVQSGSRISLFAEGAEYVYYTLDGSEPTMQSDKIPLNDLNAALDDISFVIDAATTIKCFAVGKDSLRSEIATYNVTLGSFHKITADYQTENGVISPSGAVDVAAGEDFTFQIEALNGYKISDVLVDDQSVGAVESYTFEDVSADHSITATFTVDLPFTDVKDSDWFDNDVVFVYSNNLFKGVTATTFEPTKDMTRSMLVTVLGRFAGLSSQLENFDGTLAYSTGAEINVRSGASTSSSVLTVIDIPGRQVKVTGTTTTNGVLWYKVNYNGYNGYICSVHGNTPLLNVYNGGFTDIENGEYYYGYVQWAYMKGIVNGRSSTSFAPYGYISRQDICVMLYNYLTKYLGMDISTTATKSFTDAGKISSYAVDAVNAMTNIGVINGYTDGSFGPQFGATRAEVAKMLHSLYDYLY